MSANPYPGREAVAEKGWWRAHKWLIVRRASQLSILVLFLLGPLFGIWIVKGNIASSLTLDILPLSDPYVLLQSLLAGHDLKQDAWIGGAIILGVYLLFGGRLYCSFVCPVNIITDASRWTRQKLGLSGGAKYSSRARYWLLATTLVVAVLSGTIAWELINPVSMVYRGLVYGLGLAWAFALAIYLFDIFVQDRGWCGHLCPVGAFYGLLGRVSLLRVRADARAACNDCMDCYAVCPEPQVITPALKGERLNHGPVIDAGACSNCGRCIDVCSKQVFHFGSRFNNHVEDFNGTKQVPRAAE